MYPPLASISQARRRLSEFIEAKSDGIPPTVRTRKVKNREGEEFIQSYAVSGRAICDGAEKTIWAIYRLAIKGMEQLRRVPELTLDDACVSDLPPVATNCKELCKAKVRGMRVSDRTIRSHINAGLKLGVFVKKKFRGTKANFYVWVNPDFLRACLVDNPKNAVQNAVEAVPASNAEGRISTPESTMFPLNKLLEQFSKEIETGNVEKLLLHEAPDAGGQGNKREKRGESDGKKGTGGPGAASERRTGGEMPAEAAAAMLANRPKAALSTRQRDMVQEATLAAWRVLYTPRGVTFNDDQYRKFLNTVWAGVYGGFPADWPVANQLRYHEQVLERIDMVAGYFARNPSKYPPLPYAEYVAGTGYFDAENPQGFIKTQEWWAKQQTNRINRKIAEALKSARREWRQHLHGNGPKKVMKRSLLELFRYHENRFKQWGSAALEKFYQNFQHSAASLAKVPVVA
jgi:hypothetical protein